MKDQALLLPEDFDFGYDPTQIEPVAFSELPIRISLPTQYMINTNYLPPIGAQGTCPSCASWASVYGLVTFWAAANGGGDPNDPNNQASPSFIYIKVMQRQSEPANHCSGSKISNYFSILQEDEGTPNIMNAPYNNGSPMVNGECAYLWQQYQNMDPIIDSAFNVPQTKVVSTKNIEDIQQILAQGSAIAYGTSLYTDFPTYEGTPLPYLGNGKILINKKTNKRIGHCMLIIGYDDNCNNSNTGAFLVQNSQGSNWGTNGTIWMAYDTLTHLAQGQGFYIPNLT